MPEIQVLLHVQLKLFHLCLEIEFFIPDANTTMYVNCLMNEVETKLAYLIPFYINLPR